MKIINIDVLQTGDIVLTTSTQKVSSLIRSAINSDISHAMICVAYGSVMDSTSEGVQARNIQKMFYDDDSAIYILRTREPLSANALKNVIEYARGSTGTSYSMLEAAAVVIPKLAKSKSVKQFCSRMVARAYASAGVSLVADPEFCSPEELKNSQLLKKIEPAWSYVSDEEMSTISEAGDTTVKMREVTQELLRRVRALDESIENLNDINQVLIRRPDLDRQISDALRSSGYLDHWKVEQSRFPWRYDSVLIVQFYHSLPDKNPILDYCRATLRGHAAGDFTHWEVNAKGYSEMNRYYPREAFQLLMDLYITLSFNHNQRVKSARLILKVYGGGVED